MAVPIQGRKRTGIVSWRLDRWEATHEKKPDDLVPPARIPNEEQQTYRPNEHQPPEEGEQRHEKLSVQPCDFCRSGVKSGPPVRWANVASTTNVERAADLVEHVTWMDEPDYPSSVTTLAGPPRAGTEQEFWEGAAAPATVPMPFIRGARQWNGNGKLRGNYGRAVASR
jgi:hypothetical protein